MKTKLLILFSLFLSHGAQAEVYKLVDENGHVTYSNVPIKGAKVITLEPLSTFALPKQKTSAASPPNDPRIDGEAQKKRDGKRRDIQEQEPAAEIKLLEKPKQSLAEGEATRGNDEHNDQKHLDQVQGLKDNVGTLNKETALPPASPAIKPTVPEKPAPAATGPSAPLQAAQSVEPVPAGSASQQCLEATRIWLAKEDGGHYTIQLMLLTESGTAPNLERVLRKLEKELGLEHVYAYSTRITADHQFGITFGNFPTRAQALAAIDSLPVDYKINRPMLRTVKGIRDEIEKTRAK